jgi:hypothetical protein
VTFEPLEPWRLNIRDGCGRWLCPVCGFPGHFQGESFDRHGGVIGTGICPCCLFEPGFDDVMAASGTAGATSHETVLVYRRDWIAAGMPWRGDPANRPGGWDPRRQLDGLLEAAPEVA